MPFLLVNLLVILYICSANQKIVVMTKINSLNSVSSCNGVHVFKVTDDVFCPIVDRAHIKSRVNDEELSLEVVCRELCKHYSLDSISLLLHAQYFFVDVSTMKVLCSRYFVSQRTLRKLNFYPTYMYCLPSASPFRYDDN